MLRNLSSPTLTWSVNECKRIYDLYCLEISVRMATCHIDVSPQQWHRQLWVSLWVSHRRRELSMQCLALRWCWSFWSIFSMASTLASASKQLTRFTIAVKSGEEMAGPKKGQNWIALPVLGRAKLPELKFLFRFSASLWSAVMSQDVSFQQAVLPVSSCAEEMTAARLEKKMKSPLYSRSIFHLKLFEFNVSILLATSISVSN